MRKIDEEHFAVNVTVAVSRQFLSWVISLGEGVIITSPNNVVENMRSMIVSLNKIYGV